ERIKDELNKLLDSYFPQQGCQIIVETTLFSAFDDARIQQLFDQSLQHAWRLVHLDTVMQKWCLLFYAGGLTGEAVQELTSRLRLAKR
ncbi:hypothetical protein OH407_24230, partial [Salmonella enterica]|uniref:hypothetical protein n=1 Tax=Salmonella enterica TaxID=28901 RepID=UPI0022B6F17B